MPNAIDIIARQLIRRDFDTCQLIKLLHFNIIHTFAFPPHASKYNGWMLWYKYIRIIITLPYVDECERARMMFLHLRLLTFRSFARLLVDFIAYDNKSNSKSSQTEALIHRRMEYAASETSERQIVCEILPWFQPSFMRLPNKTLHNFS